MLPALPRPDFLRLLIFGSSRFDQRTALGQVALALGCETPAHAGWYLYLDAIAVMLTSMFKATGLELKPAADAVREHWEAWLELVTQAERKPIFGSRGEQVRAELFFAVATMFDRSHRVAVGETQDITTALGKADQPLHAVGFVSIHRVLHQLRGNAEIAKPKIALPEKFTVARDEPGHQAWLADIAAYQERAGARFRARAKAKGQRAARPPARMPLVVDRPNGKTFNLSTPETIEESARNFVAVHGAEGSVRFAQTLLNLAWLGR